MKKLLTIILTLSFVLTIVGGAFADTTPTQDPGGTQTTTSTPSTIETTPSTIDTTTPTASPEIVDVNILAGTLKAINFVDKKFNITYSKRNTLKEFTYTDKTPFELNGKAITPESIPMDSKIVVKYLIFSDKSEKVVKIQVTGLEEKAYPGTIKAIDLANKTITITSANKKLTKQFVYDENTKFEYKNLKITPDLLVVGSKVVVKYQVLSDSVKLVKFQLVEVPKKDKEKHNDKDNKKGKDHDKNKNKGNIKSKYRR